MKGTFIITYSDKKDYGMNYRLDGRKIRKNLLAHANEVAHRVGADSFRIVQMEGGDWVQRVEDCPLHKVLKI